MVDPYRRVHNTIIGLFVFGVAMTIVAGFAMFNGGC